MNQDLLHSLVIGANVLFTSCRIAAHVPQLVAIVRDPGDARAVSVSSWTMFAMANSSNAVYAAMLASDGLMWCINLISAVSCMTVAGVAWHKQRRASRDASDPCRGRTSTKGSIEVAALYERGAAVFGR
jgi:hypothetical protein